MKVWTKDGYFTEVKGVFLGLVLRTAHIKKEITGMTKVLSPDVESMASLSEELVGLDLLEACYADCYDFDCSTPFENYVSIVVPANEETFTALKARGYDLINDYNIDVLVEFTENGDFSSSKKFVGNVDSYERLMDDLSKFNTFKLHNGWTESNLDFDLYVESVGDLHKKTISVLVCCPREYSYD